MAYFQAKFSQLVSISGIKTVVINITDHQLINILSIIYFQHFAYIKSFHLSPQALLRQRYSKATGVIDFQRAVQGIGYFGSLVVQGHHLEADLFLQPGSALKGYLQGEGSDEGALNCQNCNKVILTAIQRAGYQKLIVVVVSDAQDGPRGCVVLVGGIGSSLVKEHSGQNGEGIAQLTRFCNSVSSLIKNDRSFPDKDRNDLIGAVLDGMHACFQIIAILEGVPVGLGKVSLSLIFALFQKRNEEQVIAKHELCIHVFLQEDHWCFGEGKEERLPYHPYPLIAKKCSINLFQQTVPQFQIVPCSRQGQVSERIWLLALTAPFIVVSGERIEGAQLVPPRTELISHIIREATDISSHYLLSPELIVEVIHDGAPQKLPGGCVVARPVDSIFARSEGGAASQDERLLALGLQIIVGGRASKQSVVDMDIGLDQAPVVSAVQGRHVTLHIIDSRGIRKILAVVEDRSRLRRLAGSLAEASELV